jgi:hypothetical protein
VISFSQSNNLTNQLAVYLLGGYFVVSEKEGENGLPFVSADDPRLPFNSAGLPITFSSLSSPMSLATGIEARLIEAEAQLAAGNTSQWLTDLNALRTNGTYTTSADSTNPALVDTTWNPGSGQVAGLAPLKDPGTPNGRVNLLFYERAFWLFGSGHRQGDLRRLVRQYQRVQSDVFPVGPYQSAGQYGSDITFPVTGEAALGLRECIDRSA